MNTGMEQVLGYFPDLSEEKKSRFAALGELYKEWNDKINVVSRKDIEQLYERHVLHSLAIARVIQFRAGTEILDVGTGGGFPGIPLAIMFPDSEFHLVGSIGKKITVVKEVAAELGLRNVKAEQIRAEQINYQYEFIVSRAVSRTKPLIDWIRGKISKNNFHDMNNGLLLLKGGDLKEELMEAKRRYKVYELSSMYKEEFFETKKVVYIPWK